MIFLLIAHLIEGESRVAIDRDGHEVVLITMARVALFSVE